MSVSEADASGRRRVVFRCDDEAEEATKLDGISLCGAVLRVKLAVGDEWVLVDCLRLDVVTRPGDEATTTLTAATGTTPLKDALGLSDARLGARVVRLGVVAYSKTGAFAPTLVWSQDAPRSEFAEEVVRFAGARYNALGTEPLVDDDGRFFWTAPETAWRRLRVTRARRRIPGHAVCAHCVRTGPSLLACCASASFCDASCAKAAWLFQHRRSCDRDAPVSA